MDHSANPLVCVCVPAYNSGRTIAETLDSILGQTYKNLRVYVVDNASTDNTLEIVEACAKKDARVRVFRNEKNVGAEGNFTRCLQLAAGDYTALFHADDIYTPRMIEEEVVFMETHREAGAVFTMAVAIDRVGKEGHIYTLPSGLRVINKKVYGFADIFRAMLKYGNFLFCPAAMARTVVYRDLIKTWDPGNYGSSADGHVWLRILQKYPIGIIDKPLLKYRISPGSFSYHLARAKTEPHKIFRLFDDYIKGPAAGFIGSAERKDYEFLILKDNMNRAFNLLALGRRNEVPPLLGAIFSADNIAHALKSAGHFKVIVLSYGAWLLSIFPMGESLKKLVLRTKFGK